MLLVATTVITNTSTAAISTNVNRAIVGAPSAASKISAGLFSFLGTVNWSSPSWDLFIVLFFVITVFLYGLSLGRDRIIVILVSIYMALAVISNAPYLSTLNFDLGLGPYFAFKVTAFLAVFLMLFFLLSRSALQRTFGNLAAGKWWQVFLFSTFHVGLLVSITISFLPKDALANLAPLTKQLFGSEAGRFFWIVAPIVALSILKIEDGKF